MKFLIYLQPPKEILREVESYRRKINEWTKDFPGHDTHCTLLAARVRPENESRMVRDLEALSYAPFTTQTSNLEYFDHDEGSSLVLKVEKTPPLQALHLAVGAAVKRYIDWEDTPRLGLLEYQHDRRRHEAFHQYGSVFAGDFYNPHMNVADFDLDDKLDITNPDLIFGRNFQVDKINFSRKNNGRWEKVSEIPLRTHVRAHL